MEVQRCPECSAHCLQEKSCQEQFHQLLFWEDEFPDLGAVHHLMVLCYHLQHPKLLSPEGLTGMQGLLCEFVENDLSPAQVRKLYRRNLSSTNRTWRVRADAKHHGAYAQPISWNMTTQDIVFAGHGRYLDSVRTWAKSILQDLRASGNIRPN